MQAETFANEVVYSPEDGRNATGGQKEGQQAKTKGKSIVKGYHFRIHAHMTLFISLSTVLGLFYGKFTFQAEKEEERERENSEKGNFVSESVSFE